MVKKLNKYYVRDLEDRNRGLKKRLALVDKASRTNHHGLHYWKNRALDAENDLAAIRILANGELKHNEIEVHPV